MCFVGGVSIRVVDIGIEKDNFGMETAQHKGEVFKGQLFLLGQWVLRRDHKDNQIEGSGADNFLDNTGSVLAVSALGTIETRGIEEPELYRL